MSEPAYAMSGIADRYATALFELADEAGQLDAAEADVETVRQAIRESADLHAAATSPIYTRDDQRNAMLAVAKALNLGPLVTNVIGLMAEKRRLFVLPAVCDAFLAKMSERRGEVTAKVTTASALSDAQTAELIQTLKTALGREVKLDASVDESLIGGMVVLVGSKLIDTSVRSKLDALQNAMREAG